MDLYDRIEKIIEVVFTNLPATRLFESAILKQIKKIPESKLEMMLSEIKEIIIKND